MKFGIGVLYTYLYSTREFRENRFVDRNTLLADVNEFLAVHSSILDRSECDSVQKIFTLCC
jgi:hypothetical protein